MEVAELHQQPVCGSEREGKKRCFLCVVSKTRELGREGGSGPGVSSRSPSGLGLLRLVLSGFAPPLIVDLSLGHDYWLKPVYINFFFFAHPPEC